MARKRKSTKPVNLLSSPRFQQAAARVAQAAEIAKAEMDSILTAYGLDPAAHDIRDNIDRLGGILGIDPHQEGMTVHRLLTMAKAKLQARATTPEILPKGQAAKRLKVHPKTLRRWLDEPSKSPYRLEEVSRTHVKVYFHK